MSATQVMAAIDALVAGAGVAGLTTERGMRPLTDLELADFPHAFIAQNGDVPLETVSLLDHLQEERTYTVAVAVAFRDRTQVECLEDLETIRQAIRADRTLGGTVRWSFALEFGLAEHPARAEKVGLLVVVGVEED